MQKMENDYSGKYTEMEMEGESRKSVLRALPYRRQTIILVFLVTVCMIFSMVMTSVIFSHQERKFSMLESWMKNHTSDLTSVKSDFQITGNDIEKKAAELHMLVSSLSSHLNTSAQEKKLSTIETLMTELGSSLSSLASKQEENQQKMEHKQDTSNTELKSLMDSLSASLSAVRARLSLSILRQSNPLSQSFLDNMSSSMKDLQRSVGKIRSSILSLTYKLSFNNFLASGCTEPDWIPFSNSCYLFSHNNMNWTEAKDSCEQHGGLLLKIEDGSEKEWEFARYFDNLNTYWVGLTDANTGHWRWADDTPYTMNKEQWSPGQPDDWTKHGLGEEGEDCGHITIYGLLNDIHCSTKTKYICEAKNPKLSS